MSRTAPAPATRQDRRKLELEQRREQRRAAREKANTPSVWRSPMVLFTGAAVVIGVLIVGFMLLSRPAAPSVADLNPPSDEIPFGVVANGRVLGDPAAKVTVDIWSDFQCPACMNFATEIEPPTISSYVAQGKVKLIYHDAAFQGKKVQSSWDESVQPAAAARCAADQGKFWQMHNWLFANWNGENQGAFAAPRLTAIATGAGLDTTAYAACMAVGDKQTAVNDETAQALTAGINQTPTIIVNGKSIVGSPSNFATFAMILDQALAAAQ
jgi:protein-disulfide isomerase